MSTTPLAELLKLSEAERIQLAQDLWDRVRDAHATGKGVSAGFR